MDECPLRLLLLRASWWPSASKLLKKMFCGSLRAYPDFSPFKRVFRISVEVAELVEDKKAQEVTRVAREILDEIRAVEAESEQILEQAREEARRIVQEARQKSAELIREAEENARVEGQANIARAEEDARRKAADQAAEKGRERSAIIDAARGRTEAAAQFIVDKVVS